MVDNTPENTSTLESILSRRNGNDEVYLSDVTNYFGISIGKKANELQRKLTELSNKLSYGKEEKTLKR